MVNFALRSVLSVFRKKGKIALSVFKHSSRAFTHWNSLVLLSSPRLRSGGLCVYEETT